MSESGIRVRVNPDLCEGHALCIELAPEVFDLGDDEAATCVANVPDSLQDRVKAAVDACPRQAISLDPVPMKGR
jgi:ferredoxin